MKITSRTGKTYIANFIPFTADGTVAFLVYVHEVTDTEVFQISQGETIDMFEDGRRVANQIIADYETPPSVE